MKRKSHAFSLDYLFTLFFWLVVLVLFGVTLLNSANANAQEVKEGLVGTYTSSPAPVVVSPNPTTHPFRPNTFVGPVVVFNSPEGYPVNWALLRANRLQELADQASLRIHFEFDSIEFQEEAGLQGLANLLQKNPDVGVRVAGHTDQVGSNPYNLNLGLRRAQAVRQALLNLGVESKRIRVQSYGESLPLYEFSPPIMNRRVEVTLFDLFSQ